MGSGSLLAGGLAGARYARGVARGYGVVGFGGHGALELGWLFGWKPWEGLLALGLGSGCLNSQQAGVGGLGLWGLGLGVCLVRGRACFLEGWC